MLKQNKSFVTTGAMVIVALLFSAFIPGKISPRLEQKLQAAVESAFTIKNFELVPLAIKPTLDKKTPVAMGAENFFEVKKEGVSLGYAYLGQAPSMKNIFDYVVVLTPNMQIKKTKVLIYREDYGRQIGSQRWLKQFIGKKAGESVLYGQDVDAISGATISARSLTKAVSEVLASMAILQSENAL